MTPRIIHPLGHVRGKNGWAVVDQLDRERPIGLDVCGDINIYARKF